MDKEIKLIHKNYEKITDELMWLSKNWSLKFTVILNRNTNNGRVNYHKEIGYYKDNNLCVNINRVFDYYILIDSVYNPDTKYKESVSIRVTDMYVLRYRLNQVEQWFTSSENKNMFVRKDGKIIMPRRVEPIRIAGLMFNKYLEFEPSILNKDNGEQEIGVRIYVNSDTSSFFMQINRFLSFKYFIDTFNMYQSAQLMLNYIHRPSYGTNLITMNSPISDKPRFM